MCYYNMMKRFDEDSTPNIDEMTKVIGVPELVEASGTVEPPALVEITTDEFKTLVRGLVYLESRSLTYHSKIAKRAFGSQKKAREADKYGSFVGMLDILVDREILETDHRKYAFADGVHLTNIDFSEIFVRPTSGE